MIPLRHLLWLLAASLFFLNSAQAQNVKTLLENAPKSHPRLFLPAGAESEIKAKADSDALLGQAQGHVIELADEMIPLPPVERELQGRRLLGVSRTALRRLAYLSMAYRLTGDTKYAQRAEKEMLAVAAFSDWNPSHFLDVAEMTAGVAIGYDWCYDALSAESRETIRQAIIEKGLEPSFGKNNWWVTHHNNWNQVCHAGMVMGALAIHDDEPELAEKTIQRTLDNIHHGMEVYAPDGAYPEGPMYWSYGTMFNVLLIDALESVLGSDFGLTQTPGFLDSAEYFLHVTGPSGEFFNYQDCSKNNHSTPILYWFAAKENDSSLLWREREELKDFLGRNHNPYRANNRMFPLMLVWAKPLSDIPAPAKLHWKGEGITPVGLHRTSWTEEEAMFLGIKGGSPNAGHGHMDIGTFVMESDGVRWAIDLGMQDYHGLESKNVDLWREDRWKVFRLNNYSHSVLTVDGQLQVTDGYAPIIKHANDGAMPHTVIDTSEVYAGQLASAKRGAGLHEDGYVVIRDELKALDHETEVRWGMATKADVTLENDRLATLRQDGEALTLQVLAPAAAKLEIYPLDPPPADYDEANPGAKMIGFKVKLPAGAEENFSIILSPGAEPEQVSEVPILANW